MTREGTIDPDALLRHADWVRALARELVRDVHLAEDAAQDTMVTALTRPPGLATNPRGWLAAVLRNRLRMGARTRRRRRVRERAVARPEDLPSASDLVERLAQHRQVVEEVQALPEPVREAILLRFFEGCSLRQIAVRTGVPVPTVTSRLRRGVELLRQRLDRRYGDRRAWVAALLPLAGDAAPPAVAGVALLVLLGVVASGVWWAGGSSAPPAGEPARADAPLASRAEAAPAGEVPVAGLRRAVDREAVEVAPAHVLTGLLLDARGVGLAGVRVGLFPARPEDRFPRARVRAGEVRSGAGGLPGAAVATARSGPDGRFAMRTPTLDGRVRVTDRGWATVLAAVSDAGLAGDRVVVAAPAVHVRGDVVDQSGAPVPGARVAFAVPEDFRARFDRALDAAVQDAAETRTDARGGFGLDVPRVEGIALTAACRAYHDESQALDGGTARLVLRPVVAATEPVACLRVTDGCGRGVSDARVAVDARWVFDADARGMVRVPRRVLPAHARVVVLRPGYRAVSLAASELREPCTEVLAGEPALSITGRVVDVSGAAVAGAWVWLRDPTLFADGRERVRVVEAELAGAATSWNVAHSDAAGCFRIDGLLDRAYDLRVSRAGNARFGARRGVRAGAVDVELRYPTEPVVDVVGRVVDRVGRPVAGAHVAVCRAALEIPLPGGRNASWFANGPATRTDAQGAFALQGVPQDAELAVSGAGVYQARVPGGEWGRGGDVHLEVARRCHLQVAVRDVRPELSFAVLDAAGREVQIRLFLGISSRPFERCRLTTGRSAVVVIPDDAREVVLYEGARVVARRGLVPVAGEVVRVGF